MKKKIFFVLIILLSVNCLFAYSGSENNPERYNITQKITINQLLKSWSKYHKDFYNQNYIFVLDPRVNANIYISKQQADIIIKQDFETLKTFLKNNIKTIKFKIINAGNTIVVYILPTNIKETYQTKAEKIIRKLEKIDNEAKKLKNFNYKDFHKDIKKMILKLKTYQNIEN